mmetsp:Transcript_1971/g.4635  ORF Transcript_1971/g.4635 Transcript_1971/m.4635 type:complete len:148 (+) Transcript_1971:672-1115(+)
MTKSNNFSHRDIFNLCTATLSLVYSPCKKRTRGFLVRTLDLFVDGRLLSRTGLTLPHGASTECTTIGSSDVEASDIEGKNVVSDESFWNSLYCKSAKKAIPPAGRSTNQRCYTSRCPNKPAVKRLSSATRIQFKLNRTYRNLYPQQQ